MSSTWLQRIKKDLVITLGDGNVFKPTWINAKKTVSYNIASFDFPNQPGTLIKRSQPLGRTFDLEIFFQGENHIDNSNAFENSAKDPRAWTISHPYYDTIIVQPSSLQFDNSQHNLTRISGMLLETIVESNPSNKQDPVSEIQLQAENMPPLLNYYLTNKQYTPNGSDVQIASNNVNKIYKLGVPQIKLPSEVQAYNNLFSQANAAVNTAIANPTLFATTANAMLSAPAKFTLSLQTRLNLLQSQFATLRVGINTFTNPSSKLIYQNTAATILTTICYCYVFPFSGEKINARTALNQMQLVLTNYNAYLADLDAMQTTNGGSVNSFIPDGNIIISLNNLINTTVSNLYQIALNAKKQMTLFLEKDTNLILLTHRLYGLDANDENMDDLFTQNNWGLDHILQIKKGTTVTYYI